MKTDLTVFENVKDQIGFCGIWCGSCVVGNGSLRELTKKYEQVVRNYGLEEWGPRDIDYKEFLKNLASLQDTPLCPGCLKGGGRDNCEMRACATGRKIDDCSMCAETEGCKHTEILQKMRSGALDAGLFIKTEDTERQQLVARWTAELNTKWPCCVLFIDDE
jgi:hypothetical protein